jgi:hypothetical protein
MIATSVLSSGKPFPTARMPPRRLLLAIGRPLKFFRRQVDTSQSQHNLGSAGREQRNLDELVFRCADFRNLPSDYLPVRYTATLPTAFGVPDAGGNRHAAVRFVCRSELRVLFSALVPKNDEHPPTDIRKGEAFLSQVVKAVRNGPNGKDSIIFITYDEHGGFYDHVPPAPAPQNGALNPDGIDPGQCADLSNPPLSEVPGNGVQGTVSPMEALAICAAFTPSGPYPADYANFNQLGFRVPFIAVSPFAKPRYVSHTVGDHTSMLALIEKRFLSGNNGNSHIQSLTARRQR